MLSLWQQLSISSLNLCGEQTEVPNEVVLLKCPTESSQQVLYQVLNHTYNASVSILNSDNSEEKTIESQKID